MSDVISYMSIALDTILAAVAIYSAYVARQSTTRMIEEERTPVLDLILDLEGKTDDVFFTSMNPSEDGYAYWPIYICG
ncbi:MAG: hypothetical protein ABSB40_07220 [Nitrososphaeria archaeon]